MGPIRNPNWSTGGMRVTLSYLLVTYQSKRIFATSALVFPRRTDLSSFQRSHWSPIHILLKFSIRFSFPLFSFRICKSSLWTHRYSGIGSPLFSWIKNSPFFPFFLVFLWLTCAISSEKSHYFISSEKSHYFLQFTIQHLLRSILIY